MQYIDIYYHINIRIHIHIYWQLNHISVWAQYVSVWVQYITVGVQYITVRVPIRNLPNLPAPGTLFLPYSAQFAKTQMIMCVWTSFLYSDGEHINTVRTQYIAHLGVIVPKITHFKVL